MRKSNLNSKRLQLISIDAIETGFRRFYIENGHYPTASEIDKCPYLCSARHIQRVHGGLRRLRKNLGLDVIDYGKGAARTVTSKRIHELSVETEKQLKKFLIDTYSEICVHEEVRYGSSKQRVDFFVYAKQNFAVDVFNTYSLRHLNIIINIKLKKYEEFPFKLFFVVTGAPFSQMKIDQLISNKINKLPSNIKCLTFDKFKKECLSRLKPLILNISYDSYFSESTG